MLHSVRCHSVSNMSMSANSLHLASRSTSVDSLQVAPLSGLKDGRCQVTVHCSGRVENGSRHRRGRLMASCVGFREVSSRTPMTTLTLPMLRRRETRIRGAEDDFEVEDAVDYEMDATGEDDEDEGDLRDYDNEYDMPMGEYTVQESETFMSTEGVEEERVVEYKIDEDEFHKLSLYDCDFFIRKVPDQDDDVFDFREMYVTAPDTDTYAIPKVIGEMPKKPLRCMKSNYEYVSVTEPPVDTPRAPLSKTEYQTMKVFLIKHHRNLREDHEDFILDFENIYVIDSTTKSITKADVKIEVRRGKYRDRSSETLIVRDDGTTFKLIPTEVVHTPDEVIQALQWDRTRENMDNYLRGFRDYETSKWF